MLGGAGRENEYLKGLAGEMDQNGPCHDPCQLSPCSGDNSDLEGDWCRSSVVGELERIFLLFSVRAFAGGLNFGVEVVGVAIFRWQKSSWCVVGGGNIEMGVKYPGGEMVGRFRANARANYLRGVMSGPTKAINKWSGSCSEVVVLLMHHRIRD